MHNEKMQNGSIILIFEYEILLNSNVVIQKKIGYIIIDINIYYHGKK